MLKVRRSRHVFIRFQEDPFLDLKSLLHGRADVGTAVQIYACSILKEQEYPIDKRTLNILASVPELQWTAAVEITKGMGSKIGLLESLADKGLVITNSRKRSLRQLRHKEENLSSGSWNLHAALYHFMSKWRDVRMESDVPDGPRSLEDAARLGEKELELLAAGGEFPPGHFHGLPNPRDVRNLPLVPKKGGLYDILTKRKTTRSFDRTTPLELEELSVLLQYVYGCHGYATMLEHKGKKLIALKKTSPSGGALHPIEVYPLLHNVSGIDPGLYHYRVESHSLELIETLPLETARELSDSFAIGQWYLSSAQALFIMSARFYRHNWKYRNHKKAYGVILMDAAHLSQTFYLVCTELGLGALFTAAINNANIEERLGLDPSQEGVIGICACGKPSTEHSPLEPRFRKYVPRKTLL